MTSRLLASLCRLSTSTRGPPSERAAGVAALISPEGIYRGPTSQNESGDTIVSEATESVENKMHSIANYEVECWTNIYLLEDYCEGE
jgi:hypothetical protein